MTDSKSADWDVLTLEDLDRDTAEAKDFARAKFRAFCTECGLRPTDEEIEAKLAPIFAQVDANHAPLRLQLQSQHARRLRIVH